MYPFLSSGLILFHNSAPFFATSIGESPLYFCLTDNKKLKKGFTFWPYLPEHLFFPFFPVFPRLLPDRDLLLDFLPQSIVGAIFQINCNPQF